MKRFMDEAFRVPGTNVRFGWDPLIGMIPWVGDAATALFGAAVVLQAHQMRVPRVVQVRMLLNIAIDLVVGAIPLAGDLFDFAWKANTKNFALLERHAAVGGPARAGDWLFVGGVIATILAVALVPLFVVYWLLDAIGPHLPAFSG